MAYGTTNGVANNIKGYAKLITDGEITTLMVSEFRARADGEINAYLAKAVPLTSLPLAAPTQKVNNISDDLTTYYILRRLFMDVEPNDSDWVEKFRTQAMDNLDFLVKNPDSLVDATGAALVESGVESTTDGYDQVCGMSRTADGETVTDDYETSMDIFDKV